MNYKLTVLPNKLKLLTVPIPTLASATLTVWVKSGSRDEGKEVSGISHFLEHMGFKGSRKRPSAKAISEEVDAMGGEFNAGTSKDWTDFYIKARAANLETSFDIISDMLINPLLKTEEIEREKGVIIEEINMYEDTPQRRVWDIFEQLVFQGSDLGRDVAGTAKTVQKIQRSDFLSYRKVHYYTDSMLLTVSGGINENEVAKLAEKYFLQLAVSGKQLAGINNQQLTTNNQVIPRVRLYPKKKDQAHFILGFRGHGRDYPGRYAEGLLAIILGGGMSSRLFLEVRERRGLAYAVASDVERFQDTGYLSAYAGVDTKRVDEAIKVTLDQFYKIANGQLPIANGELTKAKEFIKGHLALSLEDTRAVNGFFGEKQLFLGKAETPEEVFTKIDKVTVDDVAEEAKNLFVPEKLNLAIIGPYDDQVRFEKLVK